MTGSRCAWSADSSVSCHPCLLIAVVKRRRCQGSLARLLSWPGARRPAAARMWRWLIMRQPVQAIRVTLLASADRSFRDSHNFAPGLSLYPPVHAAIPDRMMHNLYTYHFDFLACCDAVSWGSCRQPASRSQPAVRNRIPTEHVDVAREVREAIHRRRRLGNSHRCVPVSHEYDVDLVRTVTLS